MRRGNPSELGFSADRLKRVDEVAQRYVDSAEVAGVDVTIGRRGLIAHRYFTGDAAADTLYRIYSMTKPITSVAVMILVEECRLRLTDPVSRFFSEFANMQVYVSGEAPPFETRATDREITIRDLLAHTSGLAYGIGDEHPVEQAMADTVFAAVAADRSLPLREIVRLIAELPLVHQPGSAWRYSIGIDVLGAIIEEVAECPLQEYLAKRVFEPLGMTDTFFTVPADKRSRLATLYTRGESGLEPAPETPVMAYTEPNPHPNGGGGLVSSTADYLAFAQMLLDGGIGPAEYGSHRILGPRTVDLMLRDHLPPRISGWDRPGYGFGLGGSVLTDPARAGDYGTPGRFAWGGAAGTFWWIEPEEALSAVMMIQLMPADDLAMRNDLYTAVHQALMD